MTIESVSREELRLLRIASNEIGRRPVEMLAEQRKLSEEESTAIVAATLDIPKWSLTELLDCTPAFDLISYVDASERTCVCVRSGDGGLWVVTSDPFDLQLQDWIEFTLQVDFHYVITTRTELLACLSRYEESLRAVDQLGIKQEKSTASGSIVDEISFQSISDSDSAVIRLVNSTLYDAYRTNASDIHLETVAEGMAIKYRIDGVLGVAERVSGLSFAEQVISRIKVAAELDIAERRVPQDGRFKVSIKGREVNIRVSIMPSVHGEDAVLRILDRRDAGGEGGQAVTLDTLGFENEIKEQLRDLALLPYGMLLVTGPTGSGKTTTIYAILSEVNSGTEKIITIEDPVEYQLPGILQIPVNERKGLSFARGLRSVLRHDPDRIMVGEIRDSETAEIAIQSALTGHLVYTTVHANNVYDVIGRFTHMGVDLYNFASAVNAILAQRLIRLVCKECAAPVKPDAVLIRRSRIDGCDLSASEFLHGRGCSACRGTGYRGRRAIGELLTLNEDIKDLIVGRASSKLLRAASEKWTTQSLRSIALEMARRGITTLEEVNRVTAVA